MLQCNATGYPPPSFVWTHLSKNNIVSNTNTLILSQDVVVAQYQCQVKNYVGELTAYSTTSHSCMPFSFLSLSSF